MRRRTFLASTIAALPVAVAGCTDISDPREQDVPPGQDTGARANQIPAAHLDMDPMNNTDIGKRHAWFVTKTPIAQRLVIERTLNHGSTTVDAEHPPVSGEKPWRYDGHVYRFSYDVKNEPPATRYVWNLEPTNEGGDEVTVRFEDLPHLDREKFRFVGLADGASGDRTPLDTGRTFVYANADRDDSALVPTPDRPIIVWEPDRRARFSVTDSIAKNATLKTYQYTAEQLAPSVEAYGQQLRDRFTFELSGLSTAEREIVERATTKHGNTVEHGESPPDAFWSLADTFRQHEAVDDHRAGVTGYYLVSYDGQIYWTDLISEKDYNIGKTATSPTQTANN